MSETKVINHTIKVSLPEETTKLNVRSENLSYVCTGTEERAVEVNVTLSGSFEDDTILDKMVEYSFTEDNEMLEIRLEDLDFNDRYGRLNIDINIMLPRGLEVNLEAENGSIKTNELSALNITSENGGVKVDNCDGDIEIHTENGSVKVTNAKGNISIETENGSAKLENSEGDLHFNTENGSLKCYNCNFAASEIETENGAIFLEIPFRESGDCSIISTNGKISLFISEEIPIDLSMETTWGKLAYKLKHPSTVSKEFDHKENKVSVGDGSYKIKLTSENGLISVNPLDSKGLKYKYEFAFNKVNDVINENIENVMTTENLEKIEKTISHTMEDIDRIATNLKGMMSQGEIRQHIDFVKQKLETFKSPEFKEKVSDKVKDIKSDLGEILDKISNKISINLTTEDKPNQEDLVTSRKKILSMLAEGKITVEEAEKLLNALSGK